MYRGKVDMNDLQAEITVWRLLGLAVGGVVGVIGLYALVITAYLLS